MARYAKVGNMNPAQNNLLDLLRLLAGPQLDAGAAQERFQDPQLRHRWHLLEQAGAAVSLKADQEPSSAHAGTAAGVAADESPSEHRDFESASDAEISPSPGVSAETIAAFLDGRLSPQEATEVEQQCWASPKLLQEVVSTHRFLDAPQPTAPVTTSLTSRLFDLVPAARQTTEDSGDQTRGRAPAELDSSIQPRPRGRIGGAEDKPMKPAARAWATGRDDGVGQSLVHVRANGSESLSSRLRRERNRPSWAWHTGAALAGVVLALGAVLAISLFDDQRNIATDPQIATVEQVVPPDEPKERPREAMPAPAPFASDSAADVADHPEDTPPVVEAADPDPEPTAPSLVSDDSDRAAPQRPKPDPQVVSSYDALALQWGQIEGLVIGRAGDQGMWQGARALPPLPESASLATLPDSWAEASTSHGRLVMGPDTQVQLGYARNALQVEVSRGAVAFVHLSANREFLLQHGTQSWLVRAARDDTSIGFVVHGQQPLLLVRRGEARIGAKRVRQRRQASLVENGPAASTTIQADTSWFDRPQQSAKLPVATQTALLKSTAIRADLAALRRSPETTARVLSTSWSLALFPRDTFAETLRARDPQLRRATLTWLLTRNPTDPRVRQAWRALAARMENPAILRPLARWTQLVQSGQRPDAAEAMKLAHSLNHDQLLMRRMSAFFLEHAFGSHVRFDPQGPQAARQRAVRQWSQIIRRIYSLGPRATPLRTLSDQSRPNKR